MHVNDLCLLIAIYEAINTISLRETCNKYRICRWTQQQHKRNDYRVECAKKFFFFMFHLNIRCSLSKSKGMSRTKPNIIYERSWTSKMLNSRWNIVWQSNDHTLHLCYSCSRISHRIHHNAFIILLSAFPTVNWSIFR